MKLQSRHLLELRFSVDIHVPSRFTEYLLNRLEMLSAITKDVT